VSGEPAALPGLPGATTATRRLNVAFHQYNPRIWPLVHREVAVDGYALDWHLGHATPLHQWHLTANACDVFEFSLSNFLIAREDPARAHLDWVAIPVFLMKMFALNRIDVRDGAGIETFADLRGKRLGIPDFHMTAGVWLRIVLRQLYGIRPEDVEWHTGRTPADSHGGAAVGGVLRADIVVHRRREGDPDLRTLLETGRIDAAFGAVLPGSGDPPVPGTHRLPVELARQAHAEFRRQTGCTPVNHAVLMQRALAESEPDLPLRLYRAFEESKRRAYELEARSIGARLVMWEEDLARNTADFGEDPYPSGLAANRAIMRALAGELLDEGLLKAEVDVDALFAEATRTT
jgi:4,5-dihydroxyphthalate decarboxylase